MLWVLVLAVLTVSAAQDDSQGLFPLGDFQMYEWPGSQLESGCQREETAGHLEVRCRLGGRRTTLTVSREGDTLGLVCEDTSYSCEDLQQAQSYLSDYTVAAPGRTIDTLTIDNCQLPDTPLACLLSLVGASDVRTVTLTGVSATAVNATHVRGLRATRKLWVSYDGLATPIPYPTLSTLPQLSYFKLERANITASAAARSSITRLELASSTIARVGRGMIRGNLTSLLLYGNQVGELDEDAFGDAPHLVNISLNGNGLRSLPARLFRPTPVVEALDLYDNALEAVEADTFTGLGKLREILLFGNTVPLVIQDGAFSNLSSLTFLDLHDNDIASLPANAFSVTSLKILRLSGNKLATLPEDIFQNINLQELDLSWNNLTVLPANLLRDCRDLVSLNMSHNALTVLPDGFFSTLNNLNVLKITHNKLNYLDANVFLGLSGLRQLYLDNNYLNSLQRRTFDLIRYVQVLSLSYNNISFVQPPSPLAESYTNVESISPFTNLGNLQELVLHHNNITNMCDDWRNLVYLTSLDLAYNQIGEVTDVDLGFISAATVDLRHNNITALTPNPYPYLTPRPSPAPTPTFLLDNNPYTCDCNLYTLLSFTRTNPKQTQLQLDSAQCHKPNDLSGDKLSDVSLDRLSCQFMYDNCQCSLTPARSIYDMSCDQLPDRLPDLSNTNLTIRLSLKKPMTNLTSLLPYVSVLNLTDLNLTEPPRVTYPLTLDLRNNNLTVAPERLLEQNCSLYLANNPLKCGCDFKNSIKLLKQHRENILDFYRLKCENGDLIFGKDIKTICSYPYPIIFGSILALTGLISIISAVVYYKFRVYIRILLRKLGFKLAMDMPEGIKYDAFVSFAHQDEKIVMEKVLPNLEGGKGLKLCIHSRDWVVGGWIVEQISSSVEQSRCTIIVLSKSFVESVWASLEFRTAHSKGRIILLIIDDVYLKSNLDKDLKAYLSLNTYITLNDPLVWDRLADSILWYGGGGAKSLQDVAAEGGLRDVGGDKPPVLLDVHRNEEGKLVNMAGRDKSIDM